MSDEEDQKKIADRSKQVGRDGSYLELDAQDLVAAHLNGDLQKAKMIVVKASRIELSDPAVVSALADKIKNASENWDSSNAVNEVGGMSKEQLSFYTMLNIITAGPTK
jgi:hypothetical protein